MLVAGELKLLTEEYIACSFLRVVHQDSYKENQLWLN